MIGKAMARPDIVRQVIDFAKAEGIKAAYQRVQTRLDSLSPLGYSCAGTILAWLKMYESFASEIECPVAGPAMRTTAKLISFP